MTALTERQQLIEWVNQATEAGARLDKACDVLGVSVRTLQRWQMTAVVVDRRTLPRAAPGHALTPTEREEILAIANSKTYGHLPPTQM